MARDKGTYNMPGNIELRKEAPLDARRKVNTFAELFLEDTWKDSNNRVWLYDGMTVEVGDKLGELWQLKSKTSYSNPEDWIRISGGIEDAPKDGTPYMRQDGKWKGYTQIEEVYTFVEVVENNKITQEAYDGLKAAIESGKIIAYTQPSMTQYLIASTAAVMDGIITFTVNLFNDVNTVVIDSDLTYTPNIVSLLAEDNTSAYQVTDNYNPAHKKYVDDTNFGKVINGSIEILNNCVLTGTEAKAKIEILFGSLDIFKQTVMDMRNNHNRYFYKAGDIIIEINYTTNFTADGNIYELYFVYNYPAVTSSTLKRVVIKTMDLERDNNVTIQDVYTYSSLKTYFADISGIPNKDLNLFNGFGIMATTTEAAATLAKHYPIEESGTLFYGNSIYNSANQIYGTSVSNRWFARGAGNNGNKTSWKEYLFKEDMTALLPVNSNLNDFKTFGVYRQSDTAGLNTVSNRPPGSTGEAVLQVYECGPNYAVQIYYNITIEESFIRHYHNGTWGSWHIYSGIEQDGIYSGSLNDITAAGEYYLHPDVTDNPFGNTWAWVKVIGTSDFVQIVINFNNLNIMIRSKINGGWSSWRNIVTSDNLASIIKVTTAQYNASSKAADTAYFVTD